MANRHVQQVFLIGYGIQNDVFFQKHSYCLCNVEQMVLPCGQHKAGMRKCVRGLHCIPSFQHSSNFVHLGLGVWVFFAFCTEPEQLTGDLFLFGKVFALVISGKLLCRWGWLFRWLQKWKEGEGTVLNTWTFLCTHQNNCPLKLAPVYHRYTAVTLPVKCQSLCCAANGLWPGARQGTRLRVGCPVPFQNCCGAGAGAQP